MTRFTDLSTRRIWLTFGLLLLTNTLYANPQQVNKHLQQKIPKLIQQAGIPGLSIAYLESGQVHWLGEFGLANADAK